MRLIITVDIDLEESGLNPDTVKDNIVQFTKDLLFIGAGDQEIGLTLKEVEYRDYQQISVKHERSVKTLAAYDMEKERPAMQRRPTEHSYCNR